MLSRDIFSVLLCFPLLAVSAPSPAFHQIPLLPEVHRSNGISQELFKDLNDLAKIVDVTNCLQTPEGISYPFECNSFCREFPGLKLLKQWNTKDDLADSSGYIAISHEKGGEKVIIAFAGTYSFTDAVIDLAATPEDYMPLFSGSNLNACPGCKVHGGFYREWLKTEELIGDTVRELVAQYIIAQDNPYQLVLVGRKLGGAVATLAAVEFEARGWNPQVTTFGQPKVGNEAFTEYLTGKFTPSTYRRVTHVSDPVPQCPLNGLGFSHYEHEYFISKESAPYTASDVLVCSSANADVACAAHATVAPFSLDWDSSDYFHHTDTCISETTAFFEFFSFLMIDLSEETSPLQKRANFGPEFYTVLETISEEPEEWIEDNDSMTDFEKSQSVWSQGNKQKRRIVVDDSDTDISKVVPESRFRSTLAMVEEQEQEVEVAEEVYVPEFEDEELYNSMRGSKKAQSMWIKPQQTSEKEKRNINPDADLVVDFNPSANLKNAVAMLDQKVDEPPAPPQYEDEELYNSMAGFDKAQAMWIKKPQNKQKGSDGTDGGQETPQEASAKQKEVTQVYPGASHPVAEVVKGGEELDIEKRDIDRALKFFHAPKHILNAQLQANQEQAAFQAQQKAQQNPNAGPAEELDPDEDHVKEGGSVLILNGRPLEVNGRPVPYEPAPVQNQKQKRSQGHGHGGHGHGGRGHGPSLGVKRGGLKRGGGSGDKVTELQSSTPSTNTRSNSQENTIGGVIPNSFEEEVVNVDKGNNFVLMNGRRMPANFAHKTVSDKAKRSYISGEVPSLDRGFHASGYRTCNPEEHFYVRDGRAYATPEHFEVAEDLLQIPEEQLRISDEELYEGFEQKDHFPTKEEMFQAQQDAKECNDAYRGEYSNENDKKKFLHNYYPDGE